jgi:glutamate-1-semialdehyde aminotransferase
MKRNLKNGTGQKLWRRAKQIIPGGGQLLSKRSEMFLPDQWPSYYSRASGCEVWDLDHNKYLDFSIMGIGGCVLGYADRDVDAAVRRATEKGVASTLNAPEEVKLAEALLELHPWAQMVRYARSGGEATAVAVRIARAHTGRELVAFCGYHGWMDWYLSANLAGSKTLDGHLLPGLEPRGVPRGLTGTLLPFRFNRPEELEEIVKRHGKRLAAIVMEPLKGTEPESRFLARVRDLADRARAVLIVDEVSMGWRITEGGAHRAYGLKPDMAVFAKAMGNGYAMAAIIGTRRVMQAAQTTFISSTNWTERVGPTAALATIRKFHDRNVANHLARVGDAVRAAWRSSADRHGLQIRVAGVRPLPTVSFDYPGEEQALKTLFIQEMLDRGFLATTAVYASYAHKPPHLQKYASAVDAAFRLLKDAVATRTVKRRLRGPIAHSGFARLA